MKYEQYKAGLPRLGNEEQCRAVQRKARKAGEKPDLMGSRYTRTMVDRLVAEAEGLLRTELDVKKADWPELIDRLAYMSDQDRKRMRRQGVAFLFPPTPAKKAKASTSKAAKAD